MGDKVIANKEKEELFEKKETKIVSDRDVDMNKDYDFENIRNSGSEKIKISRVKYEIEIETGNRHYAGTDAGVYIKLYGENGRTTNLIKIRSNNSDDFEKGTIKRQEIECEDIGRITKIYIEHDNKGDAPGWYLEKIIIRYEDEIYNFRVKEWLSNKDKHIHPSTLVLEDSSKFQYVVIIETGDFDNAGTDSSIYIQLYGSNGKKTKLQGIDTEGYDDFEESSLGAYIVYSDDELGDINKIKIEHDSTGNDPNWYIKRVIVDNRFHFTVEEWLKKDENKGYASKIYIVDTEKNEDIKDIKYIPGEKNEAENSSRNEQWNIEWDNFSTGEELDTVTYRSEIRAPYIQNVTTNSAVIMWRVIGSNKEIRPVVKVWDGFGTEVDGIEISYEEKDVNDCYVYDDPSDPDNDRFDERRLRYRPDYQYKVTITNLKPNTSYFYSVKSYASKWNSTNSDYIGSRVILGDKIMFKTAPTDSMDEKVKFIAMGDFGQGDKQPSYYYDVFDHFHGVVRDKGVDFWIALGDIDNCTDGHPNAIDPFFFSVYNAYIGNHSVDTASNLSSQKNNVVKAFQDPPYYGILGGMPVYPTFGNHDIRTTKDNYDDDGVSDRYLWWKKGYKSSFSFPLELNGDFSDNWNEYAKEFNKLGEGFFYTYRYENSIFISIAAPEKYLKKEKYKWSVKNRIDEQYIALERYLREIQPLLKGDHMWLIVYAHDHHLLDRDNPYNYNELFSKNKVNLVLSGHEHFFEEIPYVKEYNPIRLMKENKILEGNKYDLIQIISGTAGYGDNDGGGSAAPSKRPGFTYFEIKGKNLSYYKYDTFECGANNKPKYGRSLVNPHIEEKGVFIQKNKKLLKLDESPVEIGQHKIIVETGNAVYSGTDANIYIKLYGKLGNTEFLKLDGEEGDFENSKRDIFYLNINNIGKIEKIQIKQDGSGEDSGWFLQKISILTDSTISSFTAQRWIPEGEIGETIIEDSRRIKYKVEVKTGTVDFSGTDSGIYIKLFGANGNSLSLQRLNPINGNDFENGVKHSYIIYSDRDLGVINEICIESDGKGNNPGWFCDEITVKSMEEEKYTFSIDSWFKDSSLYQCHFR